jgi:AcrR family transcriptional regulator
MAVDRKLPRREREKQRHIDEMLEAAESVFAEKGYERARMSDIAKKAEFSVGYLYQTWDGKEDLYVSLIESKFREFKNFIEEKIDAASGPAEQIDVLVDAHVDFIDQNKAFARLYLVETPPAEMHALSKLGGRLRRAHASHLHRVEKIFDRGVRNGVFIPVRPRDLALALEGIIFAFAKDHLRNSPNTGFVRRGEVMKRIFFDSILRKTLEPKKETRR